MEAVFAILDTNTFLHYLSLEQIDWSDVFPGKQVVLFVCPPVIRELNKHKDAPRTAKLRDRASAALRRLDAWADSPSPVVLSNAVEIRFTIHDARIDFAAHHLVREIADDHLIAALIELQGEVSTSSVVLLTRDTGLKLKAKAHGFSAAALPDTALLPEDALLSEKRIKELEAQVRELENARPKLRLAFPGASDHLALRFQRAEILSDADIATRMAELRNQHPKMSASAKTTPPSEGTQTMLYALLSGASQLGAVDPESIKKYNEGLDSFFTGYEKYLNKLAHFYAWESQTAAINLVLFNEGSKPADDVDIFMHFPDGFELFEEHEYNKEPEAPKAPAKPKSILEQARDGIPMAALGLDRYAYLPDLGPVRMPAGPSNVSGPKIKRTNSYDVKVHVERAKHGIEVALDVMYITFDPAAGARSFAIKYAIHASNLPTHVNGTLNVVV